VNEKQKKKQEKLNEIIKNNKKIIRIFFKKKIEKRTLKIFKVSLRKSYFRKNLSNAQ